MAIIRENLLTVWGKNEFYKVFNRTLVFILLVDQRQCHGIGIFARGDIGERGGCPIDGEGLDLSFL